MSDKNPSNDPCGSEILPSKFKTLEETNQGKYSNKRKSEGDFNLGAIKRLNLDSGLKQMLNPGLGLPEIQDNYFVLVFELSLVKNQTLGSAIAMRLQLRS